MACRREGQDDDVRITVHKNRDQMEVDSASETDSQLKQKIKELETFIDRGFEAEMSSWGNSNLPLTSAEKKEVEIEASNEALYDWDKYVCTRAYVETNPNWNRELIEAGRIVEFLEGKAKRFVANQQIEVGMDTSVRGPFQKKAATPFTLTIELMSLLEKIVSDAARLEPTHYEYGLDIENGMDEKDRSSLNGSDGVAVLFCVMQTPRQKGVDPKTFKVAISVKQSARRGSATKGKRGQNSVVDEAEEEFAGLKDQVMDYSQFKNVQVGRVDLAEEEMFDTLVESTTFTFPTSSSTVQVSGATIITGRDESERQLLADQQYVSQYNDPMWMMDKEPDIEMGKTSDGVNAKPPVYRFQRKY
jgi:hypothetical protein